MKKTFCIAGPIIAEDHYHLPFRMNETDLLQLIDQKKYFILHAPRQSGKTTAMKMLVDKLNASGSYEALYVNVEPAQAAREDYQRGLPIILNELEAAVRETFGATHEALSFFSSPEFARLATGTELGRFLGYWSTHTSKPTILFIDEIDSLVGDTLISVLRQLRAGYAKRPAMFPQSVCLIGVRDVRDYQIYSSNDKQLILGGSAFNIKAESLTIENFSAAEVRALYLQHTAATGQQFTDEAIAYGFEQTQGQPWLVNALAYQACFRDVVDRSQPITLEVMERSRETLVLRRDTHLDQLVHKLREDRVRRIIDPLIAGNNTPDNMNEDDLQYVRDLGLVTQKRIEIANPIYQEVIPRALTYLKQENVHNKPAWYINPDGSFNTTKVLEDWVQFYRENSGMWAEQFDYKESGPHLLMFAFLQRVINGGGSLHREYALGRRRVDLTIRFGNKRIVIELKIMRDGKTLPQGLEQTAEYMDSVDATEGHLIIFDQDKNKSWEEKIFQHDETVGNKIIHVWGM